MYSGRCKNCHYWEIGKKTSSDDEFTAGESFFMLMVILNLVGTFIIMPLILASDPNVPIAPTLRWLGMGFIAFTFVGIIGFIIVNRFDERKKR